MRTHVLALVLFAAACSPPSADAPAETGDVFIGVGIINPWAAPSPGGVDVAAGYMTVRNRGDAPETLTGASSPRAERVEIHTMSHEDGVMRMAPAGPVEIPVGETVAFAPEGLHLMFIGVSTPFAEGEEIPVTLNFTRAGDVTIDLPVRRPGDNAEHGG